MLKFEDQYQKQSFFSSRLFLLLVILLVTLLMLGLISLIFRESNTAVEISQEDKTIKPVDPLEEIIPQKAASSEDFLKQVKVKSEELQKEYSDNLTEFAQNRWKNIFQLVNKNDINFDEQQIEIKESHLTQDESGSKIFRIKYSFDLGGGAQEAEDWFYLMVSKEKKAELNLPDLASDVFLSENQLLASINQEKLIHITKIK